jgi:ribose 5-phosphate isomerase B
MRIAIAADHAGFQLKELLRERLRADGHEILDLGTDSDQSTDYPDYAEAVGNRVVSGQADRGILVCSTGIGMSIAANKVPGIRAAVGFNQDAVEFTRLHNDANVLALPAKYTQPDEAYQLAGTFLRTAFEGGRHARRVEKIRGIEARLQKEQVKNS